jgi:hypothetical protein
LSGFVTHDPCVGASETVHALDRTTTAIGTWIDRPYVFKTRKCFAGLRCEVMIGLEGFTSNAQLHVTSRLIPEG